MTPTIAELAYRHAANRVPRKKCNAELRQHGYDPRGPEGLEYRRAFEAAILNARMAEHVADIGRTADCVVLWEPPESDWPNWLATGCGCMSHYDYIARLEMIEAQLAGAALPSVRLHATTAEVLAEVEQLGMENDLQGRAAAINTLWLEKNK